MRTKIELFDEETGDYEPVELPARYEVCPTCEGKGRTCNLGAMTSSEYRELCDGDPDFPEDYQRGLYDVPCRECKGQRVVEVVDEDQLSAEMRERLHQHYRDLAQDAAERRQQERFGY